MKKNLILIFFAIFLAACECNVQMPEKRQQIAQKRARSAGKNNVLDETVCQIDNKDVIAHAVKGKISDTEMLNLGLVDEDEDENPQAESKRKKKIADDYDEDDDDDEVEEFIVKRIKKKNNKSQRYKTTNNESTTKKKSKQDLF